MEEKSFKMIEIQKDSGEKYALASIPVTQEFFNEIMGKNPSEYKGKNEGQHRPVECVSWFDAVVFCNKLSIKENLTPYYNLDGETNPDKWGEVPKNEENAWKLSVDCESLGYRLPAVEEWNLAISKSDSYKNEELLNFAWCTENSTKRPQDVAIKQADSLGLYDMYGNVWEWCMDLGIEAGTRTACGGAWCTPVSELLNSKIERLAYKRFTDCGFRLCKNIFEEKEEEKNETETEIKCETLEESPSSDSKNLDVAKKKNSKVAWILFVIASIIAIVMSIKWNDEVQRANIGWNSYQQTYDSFKNANDKNQKMTNELNSLKNELESLKNGNDKNQKMKNELESLKNELKKTNLDWTTTLESPVHVVIDNVYNHADGSNMLDSTKITFLDFTYTVLKTSKVGNLEKLYIKIIDPNGNVSSGPSSPQGYTTTVDINSSWIGWGRSTAGATYKAGTYVIEFWYLNACVGRKEVKITASIH